MAHVLAIDQGTTSTRVIIFNGQGGIVSMTQREHAQITPFPGWVEHRPDEVMAAVTYCMEEALKTSELSKNDIASVGITNQRETIVAWNPQTGEVYYNFLVWQDTRGAEWCKARKPKSEALMKSKTGLPLEPYFSVSKMVWLLSNVEGLREEGIAGNAVFGTVDSYILWHLTGKRLVSRCCTTFPLLSSWVLQVHMRRM
jgi:glycerol kinase